MDVQTAKGRKLEKLALQQLAKGDNQQNLNAQGTELLQKSRRIHRGNTVHLNPCLQCMTRKGSRSQNPLPTHRTVRLGTNTSQLHGIVPQKRIQNGHAKIARA